MQEIDKFSDPESHRGQRTMGVNEPKNLRPIEPQNRRG